MIESEKWIDICGYEGEYRVSSNGRIFSIKRNRIMKAQKKNTGYLTVKLSKNGIHKYHLIHRLVSENFIDNPNEKPQVNHKNKIKDDNRLENLEWVTESENSKHFHEYIDSILPRREYIECLENLKDEKWIEISDHPGYFISNFGRIVSKRYTKRKSKKDILLRTRVFGGYELVCIYGKTHSVHRLVAKYFIKNDNPNKNIVNHIDGDKLNNNFSNLEWVDHKENMIHFSRSHVFSSGDDCYYSILNSKQVVEIFKDTSTYKNISVKYGISISTVCDIKKKRSWKNITENL